MIKPVLLVAFYSLAIGIVSAQKIDSTHFLSLKNREALLYRNSKNRLLGCAMNLECRTIRFVFYDIELNKKEETISIRGRTVENIIGTDTIGALNIYLYLAQPVANRLKKVRDIGVTNLGTPNTPGGNFPKRLGDFNFKTSFSEKDRLYFIGTLYDPEEFNIGELLSAKATGEIKAIKDSSKYIISDSGLLFRKGNTALDFFLNTYADSLNKLANGELPKFLSNSQFDYEFAGISFSSNNFFPLRKRIFDRVTNCSTLAAIVDDTTSIYKTRPVKQYGMKIDSAEFTNFELAKLRLIKLCSLPRNRP